MAFARAAFFVLVAALAGCATDDLSKPPTQFGDFHLGYDIVVADNAKSTGPSRQATPEEWQAALKTAIDKRMGRYDGDKLYHLGVGVVGYALAVPGIPVLLSPKSVLVVTVDVWDDSAQRKVNAEPKRLTVFEGLSGSTIIGSGLTSSKQQQMQRLSDNAARQINDWLIANKAWFTPEAVAARATMPPTPTTPDAGVTPPPSAPAAPAN